MSASGGVGAVAGRMLVLAFACLSGPAAYAQNIVFTNANPPVVLPIANASPVSFSPAGSVSVPCVLSNGTCIGAPTCGAGAGTPTVALSAGNFTQPPIGPGVYPVGVMVTLTPTVSNGHVCVRQLMAGSPCTEGWDDGTVDLGSSPQTVLLSRGSRTYGFSLRCFNDAGATTSALLTIQTAAVASTRKVIAAGAFHTCALTATGGVKCWGKNDAGQLGDGTTQPRNAPVDVQGLGGTAESLAAGNSHTCAVLAGGSVRCWGNNNFGQLGDGTTTGSDVPVQVIDLSDARQVGAGFAHTCAVTGGGAVRCWGSNASGQVGDGTSGNIRMAPVGVVGRETQSSTISVGIEHSCVVTAAGAAQCWGGNFNGQLGDGTVLLRSTPVTVTRLASGVQAIAAGNEYTCALTTNGAVKCWGLNNRGQLGDGTTGSRFTEAGVFGLSGGIAAITAGDSHACALTPSGATLCWGSNDDGQLGDGTRTTRLAPNQVPGLTSGTLEVAAGGSHSCASATEFRCWGKNDGGQLGDGTTTGKLAPAPTVGLACAL